MVRTKHAAVWALMFAPFMAWLLVFGYAPLFGLIASFQKFSWRHPFVGGWVGLSHFRFLASDPFFIQAAANTVFFSILKTVLIVGLPLFLAYGIRKISSSASHAYASVVMISYFCSWVVISVAVRFLFSIDGWRVWNSSLNTPASARLVFLLSDVMKSFGWVFFVYSVSIRNLDSAYWEAAELEGASEGQMFRYIAVPALAPIMAVTAVIVVSAVVDSSTDQALNLSHPGIYSTTDVVGSYAYRTAIRGGHIGRATAASLVETVVRILVIGSALLMTNRIRRRYR